MGVVLVEVLRGVQLSLFIQRSELDALILGRMFCIIKNV